MALSFAFDSRNETPETVARRRAIADMLAGRIGRAQNVGEGFGDLISGMAGGFMNYRANKGEASNTQRGNDLFNGGLNFPSFSQPPQSPQMGGGVDMASPVPSQPPAQTKLPVGLPRPSEGSQTAQIAAMLKRPSMPEAPSAPAANAAPQIADALLGSGVKAAGKGWTEIIGADGKVVRREGSRNWRNNNPGNIEFGDFAKNAGAIGTDGRFAVFPSYEAGRKAKEKLLFDSGGYRGKTLAQAISRYAPSFENDTGGYISQVAAAAGVNPNTPLSALNPQQRTAMLDAMQRVEGFKPGREIVGGQPVQVASNDAPAAFQAAMPQAQPMPQPMQGNIQPAASNGFDPRWATEVIASPYTSKEQKSAAQMMLEQFMQQQDPLRQIQMQAAQQGLTKGQLEIQQMQNPQVDPLKQVQLEQERIKLQQMQNPAPKQPDPTDDMRELDAINQQRQAAGLKPYRLDEWITTSKKSGVPGQPEMGSIPSGFEVVSDPVTGERSMRPVKGSKEWNEEQKAQNKVAGQEATKKRGADFITQDIDRAVSILDNDAFYNPATGLGAETFGKYGGTNASNIQSLLDNLEANISFDKLQEMRNNSPTGGALGGIAIRELELLGATMGSVRKSQSEQQLRDNLNRLHNVYSEIVHGKGNFEPRSLSFEKASPDTKSLDAPPPSLPAEYKDLWQYMTPEDKKLWLN